MPRSRERPPARVFRKRRRPSRPALPVVRRPHPRPTLRRVLGALILMEVFWLMGRGRRAVSACVATLCLAAALLTAASCATDPWTSPDLTPPVERLPDATALERAGDLWYIYTRPFHGGALIAGEGAARAFVAEALANPASYTVTAWDRRAIRSAGRKTRLALHSFFVFTPAGEAASWRTVSFSATGRLFYSQGAWTLDAATDRDSYASYLAGDNPWSVSPLALARPIDTRATAARILGKIDGPTAYYYQDHLRNKPGYDNCNTAVWECVALAAW